MSSAPLPLSVCRECGAQKTTRTEELTYSSTRKDSETKSNHGTADLTSLVGEHNHEDTETTGKTTGTKSVKTTSICPTPGCPQRKRDRWELRRWKLDTDPTLTDTPETREWEIQTIVKDERQYVREMDVLLSGSRTPERDQDEHERTARRERDPQCHQGEQREQAASSQRDDDDAEQSSDQSSTTPASSQPTDEKRPSTATAWGHTDEEDTKPWGYPRESDTNEDQESNATG